MGCFGVRIRVARAGARSRILLLGTIQSGEASETIHQVRERFDWALRRQTEPIEGLNQSPKSLQSEQPQRAQAAVHLIEPLEKTLTNGERAKESSPSRILSFVWKLAVTADVEQVFASLAEETARMNVHSVVFDVRDHAAWGSSAAGLDLRLSRDLQRFSKPLVFELELYNESGIEGWRRNRDLYHRLRKDIDQSRKTHE